MSFEVTTTDLNGVLLLKPRFFEDNRGRFRRTFCSRTLAEAGIQFEVRQSNLSENRLRHTLRGFHYHASNESKILTCVSGELHDVVVDLRPDSPTLGRSLAFSLSARNGHGLLIPPGCANAWLTLQDDTVVAYWHSELYRPEVERGLRYNDPAFGILWPAEPVVISDKDRSFPDYSPPRT